MLQKLASRNDDIRRLLEKGYALAFDSNALVVRDIPYLDSNGDVKNGALVLKLDFIDDTRVKQTNHQAFFAGSSPYGVDKRPVPNLGDTPASYPLSAACRDVVVERIFSHKIKSNNQLREYVDLFEKVESYAAAISGPAMATHRVSPYTFRALEEEGEASVFKVRDTLTTRAEISDLASRFQDDVVAVIGLGGTGAYVLDLLAKTPVKEIRGFDGDFFHVHNAFRSPGRLEPAELGRAKAEVYQSRYESFRAAVDCRVTYIDNTSVEQLSGVTFAFVCVDKGSSRSAICDLLLRQRIPFIDVGMGLARKRGPIDGLIRTTFLSSEDGPAVRQQVKPPETDAPDDIYKTNIQIAELNALNACLAVIWFKQIRGFYSRDHMRVNALFEIADLSLAHEELK